MREVRSDVVDVASADALAVWAEDVVGQLGRVNVLISNAGVSLTGEVADLDPADMEWIVGINFWGVVNGTRAFLPHLIASGDGHVVTMSTALRAAVHPRAVHVQRHQVRRPRLLRVPARGAAGGRAPGRRDRRAPRRDQDRDRPQRRVSWREDHESFARMFDEQLARMSPERAAEIIVRGGAGGSRGGAGRTRRPPPAPHARIAGARYQDVFARRPAEVAARESRARTPSTYSPPSGATARTGRSRVTTSATTTTAPGWGSPAARA